MYKSHSCAFGKACEESGYDVRYLFSSGYEWMLSEAIKEKTIFIGNSSGIRSMIKDYVDIRNIRKFKKILSKDKPTHVYLHNYHLLNNSIAKICSKTQTKFVYHVHEPYVENKSAHGTFQQYMLVLNEYMEAKLLQKTNSAIISSKEALRLFGKAYPWYSGKKIEIPLLYEDLGDNQERDIQRKYITFVGPPVPAKGPEIFLQILDFARREKPEWKFLLISRKPITDKRFLNSSNLTIFTKEKISDEEFGSLISESKVVLTPYKRETQSSVVLVSFMHGTPVVSSDIGGLPEFVKASQTGFTLNINATAAEWTDAISRTIEDKKMNPNCRRFFIDNFAGENWKKYLPDLFTP